MARQLARGLLKRERAPSREPVITSKAKPAPSSVRDTPHMEIPKNPKTSKNDAKELAEIAQALGSYFGENQPAGEAFTGTNPQYTVPANNPVATASGNLGLLIRDGSNLPTSGNPEDIDVNRLVNAIGGLESSHDYRAVGPRTKSGDRAYGFSQVMGANIPAWTKAALGYSLTPEEYLKNDTAQILVTKKILQDYINQYGNINDAASMWFSGRPMAGNNRHDVLGTSVPQYIKRINELY